MIAEEIGFIGRDREAIQLISAIDRGQKVLVSGRTGVGKSALLRYVHDVLSQREDVLTSWIPAGNTKDVLLALARQCHENVGLVVPDELIPKQHFARARRLGFLPWKDLERTLRRLNTKALSEIIIKTLDHGKSSGEFDNQRCIIFIESLDMPPGQVEFLSKIFGSAQIVAAIDDKNKRAALKRLLWSFQTKIDLRPLDLKTSEQIAEDWLSKNPLRFSDHRLKRRFVRHVAQDSGGVPEAIAGMLAHAATEDEITPAKVNTFSHEASERYFDMTPLLLIVMIVLMAMRYVSRGLSEAELMMLSGVGSAVFFGFMFFMRAMRERSR